MEFLFISELIHDTQVLVCVMGSQHLTKQKSFFFFFFKHFRNNNAVTKFQGEKLMYRLFSQST